MSHNYTRIHLNPRWRFEGSPAKDVVPPPSPPRDPHLFRDLRAERVSLIVQAVVGVAVINKDFKGAFRYVEISGDAFLRGRINRSKNRSTSQKWNRLQLCKLYVSDNEIFPFIRYLSTYLAISGHLSIKRLSPLLSLNFINSHRKFPIFQ